MLLIQKISGPLPCHSVELDGEWVGNIRYNFLINAWWFASRRNYNLTASEIAQLSDYISNLPKLTKPSNPVKIRANQIGSNCYSLTLFFEERWSGKDVGQLELDEETNKVMLYLSSEDSGLELSVLKAVTKMAKQFAKNGEIEHGHMEEIKYDA